MRWYRRLYGPALGVLFLVPFVISLTGAKAVSEAQSEALVESVSFAMHGWTWSGWDAALVHPKTPPAQYNRGVMHATGHGQLQDDDAALKWFRLAAEGGHVLAQCNLGVLYATGRSVSRDPAQAWAWFDIAAGQGDTKARENRRILVSLMSKRELGRAHEAALELARRHRWGRGSSSSRSAE